MQKITVVGGGPAGLLFSILARRAFPDAGIEIIERNRPDEVEGWGIVLNAGTNSLLQKADPATHDRLVERMQHWSDVDTWHRGTMIRVRGKPYTSISRRVVTNTLRRRCEELGIAVRYRSPVTDVERLAGECDLLVGADGAFSAVRAHYADHFEPDIDLRPDYFIWLGTRRIFPTITHLFRATDEGVVSAEGYLYDPEHSTFIAICNPETWRRHGFDEMDRETTLARLQHIFAAELEGHALMANDASRWMRFPLITNRVWVHPRVMLLGDALHTAHFSIGSGTRLALEDAFMAIESLTRHDDQQQAMEDFERRRRPFIERYQAAAFDSLTWYENVHRLIDLDPVPFVFEAMTRSDQLGIRSLKLQDPEFVATYQRWLVRNPAYQ